MVIVKRRVVCIFIYELEKGPHEASVQSNAIASKKHAVFFSSLFIHYDDIYIYFFLICTWSIIIFNITIYTYSIMCMFMEKIFNCYLYRMYCTIRVKIVDKIPTSSIGKKKHRKIYKLHVHANFPPLIIPLFLLSLFLTGIHRCIDK